MGDDKALPLPAPTVAVLLIELVREREEPRKSITQFRVHWTGEWTHGRKDGQTRNQSRLVDATRNCTRDAPIHLLTSYYSSWVQYSLLVFYSSYSRQFSDMLRYYNKREPMAMICIHKTRALGNNEKNCVFN